MGYCKEVIGLTPPITFSVIPSFSILLEDIASHTSLKRKMHPFKKQWHWLVFFVGLAVTTWAAVYIDKQIERKAQDSFSLQVQAMEAAVARHLRSYEDVLYGVVGLYSATKHVTPEQFDAYVESLNMKEQLRALQTINYAQYIPQSAREMFLKNFQRDTGGRGNPSNLELQKERDDYMIVTRVYPDKMSQSLGIDLFQSTKRRLSTAKQYALAIHKTEFLPNKVISSGMPFRPPGINSPALAARLSVYDAGQLMGTAGIGFDIPTFFNEAIPEKFAKTFHYKMTNIGRLGDTKYDQPIEIFDSRETGINLNNFSGNDVLKKHFDIPFGGAIFRVTVTGHRSEALTQYEKYLPFIVFITGLLLFSVLCLLSRYIVSNNAMLDDAVKKRTIELQCEINHSKSLESELNAVINTERARISRDLHDDVGQRLTTISLFAYAFAKELAPINFDLSEKADKLGTEANNTMICIREMLKEIAPTREGKDALNYSLMRLALDVSKLSGKKCTFDFDEPVYVDENIGSHLHRIAKEAVNNSLRHSNATLIDIRIEYTNDKISMSIADNGCGYDENDPEFRMGMGFSTIAQRASVINYKLEMISSPGRGTTIRVTEK